MRRVGKGIYGSLLSTQATHMESFLSLNPSVCTFSHLFSESLLSVFKSSWGLSTALSGAAFASGKLQGCEAIRSQDEDQVA